MTEAEEYRLAFGPWDCPICKDAGYTNYILPSTDPRQGMAFPCPCRSGVTAQRMFAGTGVPKVFEGLTLETFPWKKTQDGARTALANWLDPRTPSLAGVFLYGDVGRGKTGLAVGILRVMAERGTKGLFVTVPELMERLRSTQANGSELSEREVMDAIKKVPFLVLDDLGRERSSQFQSEALFRLVDSRYSWALPTVYTSNLDTKDLAAHLGAPAASRLISSCLCIRLEGEPLRGLLGRPG